MANTILDFEKPIAELEEQILTLENGGNAEERDTAHEIRSLRRKLEKTKKEIFGNLTPWQRVQLARHPNRPYALDYIERIFTDFIEFHGDRRFADDPAVVGGFAKLNGTPVMVIGTQKGRNTKESVFRNFGCPHPEGYRKALRLMELADLANVPIVTLIDTPGAFPGVASEERHIGEAIAVNLRDMFALNVPVVSVVIGEGGSGGALGLGVGNKVLLMENAYYSVITPEGCAAILWNDRSYTEKAAAALNLTASDLLRLRLIDDVVEEPVGGAHSDYDTAAANVADAIEKALHKLKRYTPKQLRDQRYKRFRDIDFYNEPQQSRKERSKPKDDGSISGAAAKVDIRPASINDVQKIHDLLLVFAKEHLLLPRPQLDILERIGNFRVAYVNGQFAGCVAMRDYGNDLYEIRSLAVSKAFHNNGIASKLVRECIRPLNESGKEARVFALTYRDNFFKNLGFSVVDKELFPEKIWSDCEQCPKFHNCDEIAVMLQLPLK